MPGLKNVGHRRSFVRVLLATLIFAAIGEGGLRLLGYPQGLFISKYPPNATLHMSWGFIPFTVETNSLGIRGRELQSPRDPDTYRLAILGDSLAEGFYVDNEDTYPSQLESFLSKQGVASETLNLGVGGISIDAERRLLHEKGFPHDPDAIVLTFVTNDIRDLKGKAPEDLLAPSWNLKSCARWFLSHSALGEFALDLSLRWRFRDYRGSEPSTLHGPERYVLEGATNHEANAQSFLDVYGDSDGLVLEEPFDQDVLGLIDNYVSVLEVLVEECKGEDTPLIFAYFPAHPQTYLQDPPMKIRDRLQQECQRLGLIFCDVTEAFRSAASGAPLYLAPRDYHLTPRGNRVLAEAIGRCLLAHALPGHGKSDRH